MTEVLCGHLAYLPDGITYRQLDYWTHLGHLRPANGQHVGKGQRRTWTEHEIGIAVCMGELRSAGLDLSVAASVARQFAEGITVASLGDGYVICRAVST